MDGSINFSGTLAGSIADGGGGNVDDVQVRHSQTSEYVSVVDSKKVALIDLISYVRRNELAQAIENIENSIDNVEELVNTKQNVVNFSTEEQNTGLKWIDGKDLYIVVLQEDNLSADSISQITLSNVDFYSCLGITAGVHGKTTSFSPSQISMFNYQGDGTVYAVLYHDTNSKELRISNNSRTNSIDVTAIVLFTHYNE